jgi:hypothetical protein
MSSKEIVKALRRGLFSNTLLQMAAEKIEELENKLAELQDHPTEKGGVE